MKTILVNYAKLRDILLESSIGDLERSTERSFGHDRNDDSTAVNITNMVISPGKDTLSVNAQSHNTNKGSNYDTNFVFQGVTYLPEKTGGATSFVASDGEQYNIRPLQKNTNQVQVSCNCLDFYWTFATWNNADGSLLGPSPDPYVKTSNRPPRNPAKTPGICKHMYAVGKALQREGLLR